MPAGKIYLIPSPISVSDPGAFIPAGIMDIIRQLDFFLVENARTTRRLFSSIGIRDIDRLRFEILDKNTSEEELRELIRPVKEGVSAGIFSEAGCPGIADPGSALIRVAHEAGIRVVPLPGPSSIFLSLMGSGFNGQHFIFHGYLPISSRERQKKIREMEIQSKKYGQTQIFMETPYRNSQMVRSLLSTLRNDTELCFASDLTGPGEFIKTKTVAEWKKQVPELSKQPTIYLISCH